MTTKDRAAEETSVADADELTRNLARIEELSARLVNGMAQARHVPPALQGPDPALYTKAATAYVTEVMSNPQKLIEHQANFWAKTLQHYVEAQKLFAQGKLEPPEDRSPKDKRFSNELWNSHPWFNFIKQQYLFNAEAVQSAIDDLDGLDDREMRRIRYFSQQILDMFSPTNFLATNPEALTRAVETNGESLVKGLENLVHDIEENQGDLVVTLADKDAFKVGANIGTTPGSVVFRNRMLELIQYAPTTETVHKTPLIIFPPWINKFYILDLKEKNSLIRWIVDQGYTLFVVSWKNPDESYADTGMGDYIEEGYLEAIREVKEITGEDKINVVGYCIAGTTLSLTLALMKRRGDTSINSATFFTTLTDFSDQGEVGVFLDEDFVGGIEREVLVNGILHSFFMSRTFSYLRANDLIYAPAIRSYMLGEAPPAFDLLFWNGDGTNLPAKMSIEYLRGLCQQDKFANGKGFELLGATLKIKDVKVPLCAIACETDHIAAWRSSYNGIRKMGSRSKTFILSESGHIAGIVNPPSKKKYGHYTNDAWPDTPDEWRQSAEFHEGSWWPTWGRWLAKRSGRKVPARQPGADGRPILAPAPGTYVVEKPNT